MIKILIAGDYCPHNRVYSLIEDEKYDVIFDEVKQYTQEANFSIINLEAPVVSSNSIKPIKKCGPNLKCSIKAIKALKFAGFDMVTLANNHFYDYGEKGVKETLEICIQEDLSVVGGGNNITEAARIFYKKIEGVIFAFINCCEHEFSIATNKTGGSNPLDSIRQYYAIQEAKKNADKVILIVHGGHEFYQLPSPRMKKLYHFFIDIGADVVINHHQHCYSGYEIYNEKLIFYGLGNFCFDWDRRRNSIWNVGYMVSLNFNDKNLFFELVPYRQGDKKLGVSMIKDDVDKRSFVESVNALNLIIADNLKLEAEHQSFMEKTKSSYLITFEPYRNRYLKALYVRHLLPSFMNEKKRLRLLNYLQCESHFERVIDAITNK